MEKLERVKLEELNETKMRFFTNVSHDFKTPLSLILGPLETLISSVSDKDQLAQLHILQSNANMLSRLINHIMDLRKIENGKVRLNLKRGDIIAFARKIFGQFELMAESRNMRYEFSASLPFLQMDFDSDMIEKVLYNLISNAVKFTPPGGTITVKQFSRQDTVTVSVSDTGCGMDAESMKHIFDKFYQADTSHSQEGNGLGLALVKRVLELLDGGIRVESEPGKGSTFSVTLPATGAAKKEED